jgi:segregation and condensation protein A
VTTEPRKEAEVVTDDAQTAETEAPRDTTPEAIPTEGVPALPPEDLPASTEPEGERDPESDAFRLNLPLPDGVAFNGPLDLLLHLIERSELDITEVSLLQVTEQYLAHLRAEVDFIGGALADFVAIGSRLLLLKSRALLPIEIDDADIEKDEEVDLINALREYRRFKQAAEFLRDRDTTHQTYRRAVPPPSVPLPTGLDKVTLDSLVEVLRAVMDRLPEEESVPTLPGERIHLCDRLRGIVDLLEREHRTSFRRLVENSTSRVTVIVDFLAVLELIKSRYLEATQSERFGDIDLVRMEDATIPDLAELAEDFIGV